ncbi:MAG: type II secretion system F family protein [Armatimonadota bacterium]
MPNSIIIEVLVVIVLAIAAYLVARRQKAAQEVSSWLGMLGVMLKSGVSIKHALQTLAVEPKTRKFARITNEIQKGIEDGDSLSGVIQILSCCRTKRFLSGAAILAIEEAEKSGNLPDVLIDLSRFNMKYLPSMSQTDEEQDAPIIEIPHVSKPIQAPTENTNISDAIDSFGNIGDLSEHQDDSRPIYHFDDTPLSRIVTTIITGAISKGFSEIRFASKPMGMTVLYAKDNEEPREVMPLPKYIEQPIRNKFLKLADIPYWFKTDETGEFTLRFSDKLYQLKVFSTPTDLQTFIRIVIQKMSDEE